MPERKAIAASDLALLDPGGAFRSRLAEDRAAVAALARKLRQAAPAARPRRLAEIELLAHRLAGAAGTFGHPAVSAAALELEDRIARWRKPAGSHARRGPVERGLAILAAALDDALRGEAR